MREEKIVLLKGEWPEMYLTFTWDFSQLAMTKESTSGCALRIEYSRKELGLQITAGKLSSKPEAFGKEGPMVWLGDSNRILL